MNRAKQHLGTALLAIVAVLALALTAFIGIGIAKPNVAYAEETGGTAAKELLTTRLSLASKTDDVLKMDQYGYDYYYRSATASAQGYDRYTLVLNGLNMEYNGNGAIEFGVNKASTLILEDGSVNKIRMTKGDYTGSVFRCIAGDGSLTVKGGGKLIIEFAEQSVTFGTTGRKDSAIYAAQGLTFEHTGSIEITTARREISSSGLNTAFRMIETNGAEIQYKSGNLTFNAGEFKKNGTEGLYQLFFTGGGETPPAINIDGGSIVWNAYDGARIEFSYPAATIASGIQMTAGADRNSAEVKTNQSDLNNQKYMSIRAPFSTQLDFSAALADVDGTADGYYWHKEATADYAANTLVLSGLNLDYTGSDAIIFPTDYTNGCVLHLADGTTNRIKMTLPADFTGNIFRAIYANDSKLKVTGGGKLIFDFAPQTGETSTTRTDSAIFMKNDLTLMNTGEITVNCEGLNSKTFSVVQNTQYQIMYRSGKITLNAGVGEETHKVGQYVVFNTNDTEAKPSLAYHNANDDDAIIWNTYASANIKLSEPESDITGLEMRAGNDAAGAAVVTNQSELANKQYARIGKALHTHTYEYAVTKKPTETETGIATGTCTADRSHPTSTMTLPVLTDGAYDKAMHAATNQADAYDVYTYTNNGVTVSFDVTHSGTRLHNFVYTVTVQPTETTTGTATGTCADGDGETDTVTLPVLTDTSVYTKVTHAATTEKDAFDTYTYTADGVTFDFDIVHTGTKLPSGGGNGGGDNGNGGGTTGGDTNGGLSAGAIAGITVGSVVGVLLIVYVLGFFLFFNKGKFAGKFFTTIYKPMSKLFKK